MTAHLHNRGGAPVGYLEELDPAEAAAVLYMRLWCDGPASQGTVQDHFALALGAGAGERAAGALEALCALCAAHGRRPLMRHKVGCKCLGGDEACLANFVAAASTGDREDAMLMATLLVRADMAPGLVAAAETLGLALKRMALRAAKPTRSHPHPATLH